MSDSDLQLEIEGLKGRVARLETELGDRLSCVESAIGLLLYEQGISPEAVKNAAELAEKLSSAGKATMPSEMVSGPYQAGA